MKDYKKRIYDFIQQGKPGKVDRSLIQEALGFSTTKDFIAMDRALNDLEEEGFLYRGKKNTYLTAEQKGYVIGQVRVNRRGNGYVDREDGTSILIYREMLKGAFDQDLVLVRILKDNRNNPAERLDEGSVVKVLEHKKTTIIGTFTKTYFGLRFVADDEKLKNQDIIFLSDDDFHPCEGLKVQAKIESYQPLKVSMIQELGHVDDPGVDILAVLTDHGIEMEFPDDVKEELKHIPDEVLEEELVGRRNLCDEKIVTIDGNDSKDFDDAIGVTKIPEGWLLKVCIADVTHYVKEGSAIDREAYERGTSTYVTDRVVPMLPHQLSNGICSLNPHVVRLTNTCEMMISKVGHVLSYDVYPSYMKSYERMTYDDVNAIYEGDKALCEKYEDLKEMLLDFKDCASAIRSYRNANGAIDFDSEEAKIICDESGKPIRIEPRVRKKAEECIEDAMIAANVCIARLMKKNEFPCVYRIHEEPSMKKMTQFSKMSKFLNHPFLFKGSVTPKEIQEYLKSCEGSDEFEIISMAVLRCMQKAVYDPECVGHFGLAEHEYLHFTSPIRRYPDLIVHRMLRKYFYENQLDEISIDRTKMSDYAEQSSVKERNAQDAEYEVDDMKKAEYMANFIGEKFEGIIDSVTNYGFFVRLENTCEGLVHLENMWDYFYYDENTLSLRGEASGVVYRPGMRVMVTVLSASKENRTVDFGVVEPTRKTRPTSNAHGKRKPSIKSFNDRSKSKGDRGRFKNDRSRKANDQNSSDSKNKRNKYKNERFDRHKNRVKDDSSKTFGNDRHKSSRSRKPRNIKSHFSERGERRGRKK